MADNVENDLTKVKKLAEDLHIGGYTRHVLLCPGQACCTKEVGNAAWDMLKEETKRRNLTLVSSPQACYRTKASCLRVCNDGPIMVVYPEGTYYARMTADKIPRFLDEHIEGGKPIEEWIFARNPLPAVPKEA